MLALEGMGMRAGQGIRCVSLSMVFGTAFARGYQERRLYAP
jgi:hypothetical protein